MSADLVVLSAAELEALVIRAVRTALDGAPSVAGRLPLAQAAKHAGTTARVLRGAIHRGELPAARVGRGYSVEISALDGWLTGRQSRPGPVKARESEARRALAKAVAAGRIGRVRP